MTGLSTAESMSNYDHTRKIYGTYLMHKLLNLDIQAINSIRANWIEQVEKDDDSGLELTDSFFDYLMSGNYFGDLLQRSNQITYLSVVDPSDQEVVAITEIIYARQGAKSICKIMDISHAPKISNLEDEAYINKSFDILLSILAHMLEINKSTNHGITKIYARDDAARDTIKQIHTHTEKNVLETTGFKMKTSGYRWLEFEKI